MLVSFLYLLLFYCCVNASATLLVDGKQVQAVSSYDYIQSRAASFNRTGFLILATLSFNEDTSACEAVLKYPSPDNASNGKWVEYAVSLVAVEWQQAQDACGLQAYGQLWSIAQAFMAKLPEFGLPPAHTLLVASSIVYDGDAGSPFKEPVRAHHPGIADWPPPKDLDVLFLQPADWESMDKELQGAVSSSNHKIACIAVAQRSAWNALYGSTWFAVYTMALFVSSLVLLLVALYRFATTVVLSGEFEWCLRNALFVTAALGTLLQCTVLPMPAFSYATGILLRVGGLCVSLALHMLLYLWAQSMMQIRHSKAVSVLRLFIVASAFVALVSTSLLLTKQNMPTGMIPQPLSFARRVVTSVDQLVLTSVFAIVAAVFIVQVKQTRYSRHVTTVVTQLSSLALFAGTCYAAHAILNLAKRTEWAETRAAGAWLHIAGRLVVVLCAVSLLGILHVQAPRKSRVSERQSMMVRFDFK